MRVLTFNSHQPYLHLLASALPWTFGVITPRLPNGTVKSWSSTIRPMPGNIRLYESAAAACAQDSWEFVLTHNVQDLIDAGTLSLPKIFLVHGTLTGRMVQDKSTIDRASYLQNLCRLLNANSCRIVYISELKREDWGLGGQVIRSAIDPEQYGGYRGDISGILQVANYLKQRGSMLGWEVHQTVCRNQNSLILGKNPGIRSARMASSWEDLKEQYRSYRVYLHTAIHPYEDGFNLAMLEAMSTGMPIATLDNPTSPIEDGIDGIRARSPEELRDRVSALLEQPDVAREMGAAARRKVGAVFPLDGFRSAWISLAESIVR